ncbi:MAG: SIR2 family protein [Chloroflexota bacterium]|jgi:hypothetical protein
MPNFDFLAPESAPAEAESWRQQLIGRIKKKEVTAIVSDTLGHDLVLGGQDQLGRKYATYSRFNLDNADDFWLDVANIPRMVQYRSITDPALSDERAPKEDYVDFAKSLLIHLAKTVAHVDQATIDEANAQFEMLSFTELCDKFGYPRFEAGAEDPMLLLASFGLKVYITTSYHEFLESALKKAGVKPRSEYSRWNEAIRKAPSILDEGYIPSAAEPLVYHLHGMDSDPESLVLTEEDYLQFLMSSTKDAFSKHDPIHSTVRLAISDSSLMLLGFSLRSWAFRSLFWSMIKGRSQDLTSVVIMQLQPSDQEKKYMEKYFSHHRLLRFVVEWTKVAEFVKQLHEDVNDA